MAETLEQAFAAEAERVVRDQFRDGRQTELVEVGVVIERRYELSTEEVAERIRALPADLPRSGWQERVLAAAEADARRRRARALLVRRIATGLLVVAAGLALGFAMRSCGVGR